MPVPASRYPLVQVRGTTMNTDIPLGRKGWSPKRQHKVGGEENRVWASGDEPAVFLAWWCCEGSS